jgi:hypothetical protein
MSSDNADGVLADALVALASDPGSQRQGGATTANDAAFAASEHDLLITVLLP